MSKKSDMIYFDNFVQCADCAVQAAKILKRVLENFDPSRISESIDEIREVEHAADVKKHNLMEELMRAFITPIEREDIMAISQYLDDITDKIEDVLLRVYICNVTTVRPESVRFAKLVIRCCEVVKKAMEEFPEFKKSQELKQTLIEINRLEEEGDRLYLDSMRTLHTTSKDPVEIIVWRDIFKYLEDCLDACEHTSDIVETVIMKNS
jgi:predicted phosphate transport protein (TIGR00153 family)